jgi:SAM-dependent methyltransferase
VVTAPGAGYQGVARILRYNARMFAVALLLAALAGGAALSRALPPVAATLSLFFAAATVLTMASSLAVSHYVYDRSPLSRWDWLASRLAAPPRRWVALHAGLDDASPALRRLFPHAAGHPIDVFCPREMTEPSIAAARRLETPPMRPIRAFPLALPLADECADLVLLFFVAHELRGRVSRERLFLELRRIAAPRGRVVLVEHLRDLPNGLAFGPGALHFLPRREWLRLAAVAGLAVSEEARLTPFVRAFFLARTV